MNTTAENSLETGNLITPTSSFNDEGNWMHRKKKSHSCALVTWLIVLCITSFAWATWATFVVVTMGDDVEMHNDASYKTHIQFQATPEVNREHYERMAEIGTKSDYSCAYSDTLASCQNDNDGTVIEIWFTPKGPMYKREHQSIKRHRLETQTWPFAMTMWKF